MNDDILAEFIVESYDNLDRIDSDLLALERGEPGKELLASVFRSIHSIKGTCGFLGLQLLEKVSHRSESLLSLLRDGRLEPDPDIYALLLRSVDALRNILGHLEATEDEGPDAYETLIYELEYVAEHGKVPSAGPATSSQDALSEASSEQADDAGQDEDERSVDDAEDVDDRALSDQERLVEPASSSEHAPEDAESSDKADSAEFSSSSEDDAKDPFLEEQEQSTETPAPVIELGDRLAKEEPSEHVDDMSYDSESSAAFELPVAFPGANAQAQSVNPTPDPVEPIADKPRQEPKPMSDSAKSNNAVKSSSSSSESSSKSSLAESTIRVDVELLDRVMNLVGELVLARNRILQFAPQLEDPSFANASQRLNLLTTELQEGVMKTRMQPIGNVWNKFPRMVRDLSISCGKEVKLELDGVETELDRTIIEAIKDPLTHVVRNAIDHGIEAPEVRVAQGKPRKGRLLLRAYHEGGQVNIEVSDDGAGLNLDRIRERAIDRGLVSQERAKHLSNKEVYGFIFNPGFSTAVKVTNVSGRGVGMDVVKTNIEKIGGSVDISSVAGEGTVLKVKIPLTLAIIPALTVTSHGERFAIPQVNLLELVRLDGEMARAGIERAFGAIMYRLRGDLLPLVYLDECLNLADTDRPANEVLNIVVLQADERQFGLVVDGIRDTEEIVVKPLGKELKSISAFAGATIMGDGQVALILDVLGLAERAQLVCGDKNRVGGSSDTISMYGHETRESLLLFLVGKDARMGIPLSLVTRIEEIPVRNVEKAGNQIVVQYRGQILPLIDLRLDACPLGRNSDSQESLSVIVFSQGAAASVGFVVEEILDAVDEVLAVKTDSCKPGTLGSAVIQGCVTDLLDVPGVLATSSVLVKFETKEAA